MGDYRKQEGLMKDPSKDLSLWALPTPLARLLCRIVIFGKPIETRLAQMILGDEAACMHRFEESLVCVERLTNSTGRCFRHGKESS